MIIYKEGNLLDARVEALVNTVNTVGVMGKGIALQFKHEFPESYKIYKDAAARGEIVTGQMQIIPVNQINGVKYIINFPTKQHWRSPSKLVWIKEGLQDLRQQIIQYNIKSIAVPPLGCGNGGLNWETVKPLINEALTGLDIKAVIYEPTLFIKEALKKEDRVAAAKLTPARAMLLSLLYQYRALGEFASEFAAVKLSYFLQRFGETQLKLRFVQGHYGPYSNQLSFLLYTLNGYYLKGYEQKDAKPFEEIELVASKKEEVKNYIEHSASAEEKRRLETVTEFIQGFESPYGLELLATVDMILCNDKTKSAEIVKEQLWSERKRNLFPVHHIQLAINHLNRYDSILYKDVLLN
ncbi:type II toxin-antitoxin system antitoxin DNA ADP-ribosyl glycohydrolase DarG [Mucilaginibacter sp.]